MDDPGLRPLFPRRLRRGELIALDGLAAVGYTLAGLLAWTGVLAQPSTVPTWARCLIVAGTGGPVAVRRLWPLPVFAAVLAASVLSLSLGVMQDPFIAAAFALYVVALTEPRRRWEPTLVIGALSVLGLLMAAFVGLPATVDDAAAGLVVTGSAVMGGAWTVGRAVRERRAHAARAAEQLAERAAADERLRIARELHDVVSHTLSLIGVKAGIANHVAESRPEEVRDALRVIEATSRDALAEMRHMLGLLRSDGPAADLGPIPGVSRLPELAERAAMAGVRVDLDVRGVDRLPQGVELSVYRIVQEAVTNVVKHAAPARCRVVVIGGADDVRIEVSDDGPGGRVLPGRPGHGLIGMRERAIMHGGAFTAGPRPQGGFGVSARLPYRPSRPAPPDRAGADTDGTRS